MLQMLNTRLGHPSASRLLLLCAIFVLSVGVTSADTPPKIKFQFLLFPETVKTDSERSFVLCMVNTGLQNTLDNAEGDQLTLSIPVGLGEGDLADPLGILPLDCMPPTGWSCVVNVNANQAFVTVSPDGELPVPQEATFCFDLTGTTTSALEGLAFMDMDQNIASQRAETPVNSILPVFKSAEGTIEHDDLAKVLPDQHHPQVFEVDGDDIRNLNVGNVLISPGNLGIGTESPAADLHIKGTNPALLLEGDAGNFSQVFVRLRSDTLTTELFNSKVFDDDRFGINHKGADRFFIDANGNVTVGPFPDSTARFNVSGDASFDLPFGSIAATMTADGYPGLVSTAANGHRREVVFDNLGIRLLTSSSGGNPAPDLNNGIRILESGAVFIGTALGNGINLTPDAGDGGAVIALRNSGVVTSVSIDGNDTNDSGRITLRDDSGTSTVIIDGSDGGGNGRVRTQILQITGGADLSERFDVAGTARPGTVVSIDRHHEGGLVVSREAYDRTVAGIVSGAGGIRSGMIMGQEGSEADGQYSVALSGRVYCLASGAGGPIRPGDLLTTSDEPGRCMRVEDHDRAQGAILGKAMSTPRDGMVLVLVNLQ